jgi:hypothetical protein
MSGGKDNEKQYNKYGEWEIETTENNPLIELARNPLGNLIGVLGSAIVGYMAADGKIPQKAQYVTIPAMALFGTTFTYSIVYSIRNINNVARSGGKVDNNRRRENTLEEIE